MPQLLILHITRHPDRLTITSPQLPGWTEAPTRPHHILNTIRHGFTELDIHTYATRRGAHYDMPPPDTDPPTGVTRLADHQPATNLHAWRPLHPGEALTTKHGTIPRPCPEGSWMSPAGLVYGPNTWQARSITTRRTAAGLPTSPDGHPTGSQPASRRPRPAARSTPDSA